MSNVMSLITYLKPYNNTTLTKLKTVIGKIPIKLLSMLCMSVLSVLFQHSTQQPNYKLI